MPSTGETGKLGMIPELQELIIAVKQTAGWIPVCEVGDRKREPWDTINEKGYFGKTVSSEDFRETNLCKIFKEENIYCQQPQIIHVIFIYTTG